MKVATKRSVTAEVDNKLVSTIRSVEASEKEKESAFAQLFKKYKDIVFFTLNKALGFDSELAQDLMMDVFTKIHIHLDKYDADKAALSTWISKITRNTLIDHKRTEKYEVFSLDALNVGERDDDSPYLFQVEDKSLNSDGLSILVKLERSEILLSAIKNIKNEMTRNTIFLCYFEGKSYDEISSELNIKESQVKGFLHRGKNELRLIINKLDNNFEN